MADHASNTPTGYLQHALSQGQVTSRSFLINTQRIDDNYSLATTTLHPAPEGSHVILQKKRNSTNNNTHYIISLENPHAYAMRATLEGPMRIQLHTLINIRETNHSQVIHIQINPHTRSILGRTYHPLFLTPDTQEPSTSSKALHEEGLTSSSRQLSFYITWTP